MKNIMHRILGLGLKFSFVIGISLWLYSLFEKTNYNEWFRLVLCVCTAHWIFVAILEICATISQICKDVKDE